MNESSLNEFSLNSGSEENEEEIKENNKVMLRYNKNMMTVELSPYDYQNYDKK